MADSTSDLMAAYQLQFPNYKDGVGTTNSNLVHSTWASVLLAIEAGRGDIVVIDPSFDTVPSAAELDDLMAAGVVTYIANGMNPDGTFTEYRATDTLPQSTTESIFTVTGWVRLEEILGIVTTVIQTQANDTKLTANPTTGTSVDMCAVLSITGKAAGSTLRITGTLTDAMVSNSAAEGAGIVQATAQIIAPGTIDLVCAASNTGSVAWITRYKPLTPGARIIAA